MFNKLIVIADKLKMIEKVDVDTRRRYQRATRRSTPVTG